MRILIACECSGVVRDAFRLRGHDTWSCDIKPDENGSECHYQADIRQILDTLMYLDILICFPPCTDLCVSGARWFKDKQADGRQSAAIRFFEMLAFSDVPKIAIENPIGIMSTKYRKPDQIIQPWQFGHGETKATCLWLKGLPKLVPTDIVEGRIARVHKMAPSPNRAADRSRTLSGIANAMANQWG